MLVIDTQQMRQVGTIDNTSGVHGIAIAQDLKQGFVSNGLTASVTVFDLNSLKTVATIEGTGEKPDAIIYEPKSRRVWTFNGKSHNASVIDPATMHVVDTVALPGKPALPPPTISPGDGRFSAPVTVTMLDEDPEAILHYTIDGSLPDQDSPVYQAGLMISTPTTLRAKAFRPGWASSIVVNAILLVEPTGR